MAIRLDPEGNETRELFRLFDDFAGKSILEIGAGDGRLTWRYAGRTARVTAIEPDAQRFSRSVANRPGNLKQVGFLNIDLTTFAAHNTEKFDIAILSWSL
ncbi:MAG: hypothetical protein FJZ87_01740 [Chloroflexi bacterium]|nr:hypothetical protein [Chloroflexota bacterium]